MNLLRPVPAAFFAQYQSHEYSNIASGPLREPNTMLLHRGSGSVQSRQLTGCIKFGIVPNALRYDVGQKCIAL